MSAPKEFCPVPAADKAHAPVLSDLIADHPPVEFHVLNVIRLGGHYYVECSCRKWVSEAQDTIQQAQSISECPFDALQVEAARNIQRYRLAAVQEAHLNRVFPVRGRV